LPQGCPQVAFRETVLVTERAEFAYTHKKQTGGAGQYARVFGHIDPMEMDGDSGKDIGFESVTDGETNNATERRTSAETYSAYDLLDGYQGQYAVSST
jgi:translation elongation factor EF-G